MNGQLCSTMNTT